MGIKRKKYLWLALGCILVVNGFILSKVYINRSQVIEHLELTERELRLPYDYGFRKEDSSARVSLQWATPNTEQLEKGLETWRWYHDRRLLLSQTHFESFQFPVCSQDYSQAPKQQRKREAWVLLEFNGKSYADFVARAEQHNSAVQSTQLDADATDAAKKELVEKQKDAAEFLNSAKTRQSRLFVIDAAADKKLLEIAKAQRASTEGAALLIVPAEIQADYSRCDKNSEPNRIQVMNLSVESLYIPRELARDFFADASSQEQKFVAEVFYGRLYEPWVGNFKLMNSKP